MSLSGVRSKGSFRAALVVINLLGLWWIHHDLTAASRPGLRVLAALPNRDVDSTDRLTFVFDQPLPLSGVPGTALAQSPFAIAPQVAGQWFWATSDRLEYRLERPLPPGRRFTVRATPAMEQLTGRKLLGPAEFQYETRALRMTSCAVAGMDSDRVNIELRFNQPVEPQDLLRHLTLTDTDETRPLKAESVSHQPADKLLIRTQRPDAGKLMVTLGAALTGSGGELPLGQDARQELTVRTTFALLGADVEAGGLQPNSTVTIRFSKSLETTTGHPPHVTLTPALARLHTKVQQGLVILEGPFESGKEYTATFGDDLRSPEKEKLDSEASISFEIPDRNASIEFATRDGVLSPAGNLLVDLRAVNVTELRMRAARVHPNNLAAHLHGKERRRDETSRELPEKLVHIDSTPNVPTLVSVDFRQLIGDPLGICHIDVKGPDRTWLEESIVVAVTDLAITSKVERDGLCVWVTSLRTARPVAEAEVVALSYNGQTLASAKTDADGIARLTTPANHPDGKPWVVTAASGKDVTFLELESRKWNLDGSEIGVEFSGRTIPLNYDVMLYTERGVYRPGDTIHLTGVLRDVLGQVPPPFPLAVSVQRPDGREVAQLTATPQAGQQGFFHVEYTALNTAQTGKYEFRATLPGSKDVLGKVETLVEEYVPLRLEVKATTSKPRFSAAEPVAVQVAARYLFDQPASELAVTVAGKYRHQSFTSKQFAGFEFDPASSHQQVMAVHEQRLDSKGCASITLDQPPTDVPGCWRATLNVTVSEEGGRSTGDRVEAIVDTTDRHIGVRLPGGRIVPVGAPVRVEWIQLTGSDVLAESAAATCSLARVEYDTTLEEVDGRPVWKSVERLIPVTDLELPAPADGIGTFETLCPAPGRYRLRVTDCSSAIVGQTEFDAVAAGDENFLVAFNKPEHLSIVLDKESYTPGSTAKVVIKAPFAGTMLLTVETERVIDARVLSLSQANAEIELPVDAALRGGAFVTATVIRQIDPNERNWLPHRAMGTTRLRTDHSPHDLPLTIAAPKEARPGQTISVRVQTSSPADPQNPPMVHLWAVDDGILLATAYATPQLADHFFGEREVGVTSSDAFNDLLPDYRRPAGMARIGGDGSDDSGYERRLASVATPRRSPAVIWRTTVPVGADGMLSADLPLPDLTGRIRLMAVAADRDLYGSTEQAVTLAAPLLMEVSSPRFVAPGDRFDIPTKVFNSTKEDLTIGLVHAVDGPLRLDLPTTRPDVRVAAGASAIFWIRAEATGLGPVRLLTKAQATPSAGEPLSCTQEALFAVRPSGPLHSKSQLVRINAGDIYQYQPSTGLVPGSARTTISLSARPTVHLKPAVEQLLDYPYGCVEQTSSRMYVLLYAPDLLQPSAGPNARTQAIDELFDAGVARLWSMQTRSGGFSYWPGDAHANPWGTIYAAELLVRAERAGHKLNAAYMNSLAKYLQKELDGGAGDECDANLRTHICHVLAAMKQPPQSWMTRLSEVPDQLDMAGRAHLASAWLEVGRKDRALAILTDDTLGQEVATTVGGGLRSQIQEESTLLNCLLDLDKQHPWIPALVQRLEKARRNGQWGSTLENACALMALIRYQNTASQPAVFQGTIRQAQWSAPFNQTAPHTFKRTGDEPIGIESGGLGDIYVSVTTEGLLADGEAQEYDHQLKVSRQWVNRQGKPLNATQVRVGDLILVETTLVAPGMKDADLDNVAIVDALPGGMEVENPRLATTEQTGRTVTTADHVEFRDDRVLIFTSASATKRVYRYALRAVAAGSFVVPPVQASCMYDASFASVHGVGRVEISR